MMGDDPFQAVTVLLVCGSVAEIKRISYVSWWPLPSSMCFFVLSCRSFTGSRPPGAFQASVLKRREEAEAGPGDEIWIEQMTDMGFRVAVGRVLEEHSS